MPTPTTRRHPAPIDGPPASPKRIDDTRITEITELVPPAHLLREFPASERAAATTFETRQAIHRVLHGADDRLLVVVGPCSIHDYDAAIDYATRLAAMRSELAESLIVVMRVYFEKPRTNVGWKGLINDPHMNDSYDIPTGLRVARRLLLDVGNFGLPAATEMLDPILPQYMSDLVSWAAIGARTTESQTHRELASGLSMPVGFKNGTDGGLEVAINGMLSAAHPHRFLGVDGFGRVAIVQTSGNPEGHLVLRGGSGGPNYDAEAVQKAVLSLRAAGVIPHMIVDCSHDNSGKNHERQPDVLDEVARQITSGSRHIIGVMIESNLVGGRQALNPDRSKLVYGQSITDACVDFATTEAMLGQLADASRRAQARAA